jgi:predicted GNAT family acetyltransferase
MSLVIRRHADASAFLARAESWLLRSEAEHNLVLGLCHRLRTSAVEFESPIYLATVEREGEVVGCAFRTPPYKLGVTRMPDEAIPLLVEDVAGVYAELPAVLGPEREARAFATLWGERRGVGVRVGMRQRIYQLEKVRRPERMPQGQLRAAEAEHVDLVAEWIVNFALEAGIQPVDAGRMARERIDERTIFFWEDGGPRAMAAVAGETPHGARIGYVYTPPEWRGRGYASACTAELSQRTLESGRQFCFLYTDLANPTSNAIYQRIGYQRVCDVVDLEFMTLRE